MTELNAKQPGDEKEIDASDTANGASLEGTHQVETTEKLTFPEVIKKIDGLLKQLNEFAQIRADIIAQVRRMESTSTVEGLLDLLRRIPPAAGSEYVALLETFGSNVRLAKLVETEEDQSDLVTQLSEQLAAIDYLLQFIATDGAVRQLVEYVSLHETEPGTAIETMIRLCFDFNRDIQLLNDAIDRLDENNIDTDEKTQQRMEKITAFISVFKRQLAVLHKHYLALYITDEEVDEAFLALRKSTMRVSAHKFFNLFESLKAIKQEVFDHLELTTQTDENSVRSQALKLAATQPNPGMAAECAADLQSFLTKAPAAGDEEHAR